jgi:tetratricopeptide (TPR) repeat protein
MPFAISCASLWLIVLSVFAGDFQDPTLQLAVGLVDEGDHAGAAVEFRRLALEASGADRGAYYWVAGYEYFKCSKYESVDKMLNRAENEQAELKMPALLLRGETAHAVKRWSEAGFYYETVLRGEASDDEKSLAARRLAGTKLVQKDVAAARDALNKSPAKSDNEMAALENYAAGRDKRPMLGGFLGMIPGFGYFYSGEYANGFRSIILNSLFIYGMVDTAEKEQWGAFAVITFFEFTWYSGSIYGGIDAAHRYNRNRLDSAVGAINGDAGFDPDYKQLPTLVLQFRF